MSTPFMNIRDGHNREVSFETKEELGDKMDKLAVMIGQLATRDSGTDRPQFTKVEAEDKTKVAMTDAIMIREAIKTDID